MNRHEYDIVAAIGLVERNYAGYADKREQFGPKKIDAAARRARRAADSARTTEDCIRILNRWIRVFKDRHLWALTLDKQGRPTGCAVAKKASTLRRSAAKRPLEPTALALSDETFVITVPNFELQHKFRLEALTKRYGAEIKRRPNLIIDVRGNSGGADATFSPLVPYLYTQPVVTVGLDVLATRENADAWQALITPVSKEEKATPAGRLRAMWLIPKREKQVRAWVTKIVRKMRAAREGTFVSMVADSRESLPRVLPLPSKVGILVDRRCGSTTEQFLLLARQSKKVTLFGQPTAGVLDYSNVRLFPLPSGNCVLAIATTRSRRLPKEPIDNIGIQPDVRVRSAAVLHSAGDHVIDFVEKYLERNAPRPRRTKTA
ncbi:MAG TPA: S41 family peptidase [Verrucomicrobiae bacterium]|nr:S41 family peptidase [Verrucomicrobiae bacterium]